MRFYFYKDLNINKNDRLVTVSLWGIMSTVHNEAISSLCTGTIRENNYIRYYMSVLCSLSFHRRPDTVKQKNAFPPNFIHSLDSTHMMLTSLHCYR